MRVLKVSKRAEVDLQKIWLWTFEQFGEAQADRYIDALDEALSRCSLNPEAGRNEDVIRSGYRSRLIRKHIIYYTFNEREVLVHRVLHGRMDPGRHLI